MTDFVQHLIDYTHDRIDCAGLERALQAALQCESADVDALAEVIAAWHSDGRLPYPTFAALRALFEQSSPNASGDTIMRSENGDRSASPDPLAPTPAAPPTIVQSKQVAEPAQSSELLGGRFELEDEIGCDELGTVFRAIDRQLDSDSRDLAYRVVTVLHDDVAAATESLGVLHRATDRLGSLAHRCIVVVSGPEVDGRTAFLNREYLDGDSLQDFMKRFAGRGLAAERALPLIAELGDALKHAHRRGLVHGDFNPTNVFVTGDGRVKILNFGLTRWLYRSRPPGREQLRSDAGGPAVHASAYASCGALEGGKPDVGDDVFSLACVAYELLAGRHPFGGKTAMVARGQRLSPESISALSWRQNHALRQALRFDAEGRAPDAATFVSELSAKSPLPLPWAAGAGAAALLTIGLVVAVFTFDSTDPVDQQQPVPRGPETGAVETIDTQAAARGKHLEELLSRRDRALRAGWLIAEQGGLDDLTTVLALIRQADPGHPALMDPSLPGYFVQAALQAIDVGQYELADSILAAVLSLALNDDELINVRGLLVSMQRSRSLVSPGAEFGIPGEMAGADPTIGRTIEPGSGAQQTVRADVARLKRAFFAEAKRGDVSAADELLAEIGGLVSVRDEFLTVEAPLAMAEAYTRLAEQAWTGGRRNTAAMYVDQALWHVPDFRPALAIRARLNASTGG